MADKRTVTIRFLGDASQAKKAFGEVDDAAGKTAGKFSGFVKGLGVAAGAAAATGAVQFFKGGVESLARIEKLNAQTTATLKSMGGAAGVTVKDIEKLTGGIEKLTSVEAESVQEGANLLLTFGNIQNKAGKGNDIFDQTTRVMTDMSVALGQDMSSSAIQLGKALNDPIKGVSALQRVGVSFTVQQKDQIRAMVEAGDTMGAQKLILGELNKQFGGSAEALGDTLQGRLDKVRNQFGEMQEGLVVKLLPALTSLGEKVAGVVSWFANLSPGMQQAIGIGVALAAGVLVVVKAVQAWTAVQAALNVVMAMNPIGIVVIAIAALVAGLVWAYKNVGWFRDGVDATFRFLGKVAEWLGRVFVGVWDGIVAGFRWVRDTMKSIANWIAQNVINPVLGGVNTLIRARNAISPGSDMKEIPKLPVFHKGGVVPGPLGADVPIMAQAGETVLPIGASGIGGTVINVSFNGVTTREAAEQVVAVLEDHLSRGGSIGNGRGASLVVA